MIPDLLKLDNLELYRAYFKVTYCLRPLETHDGISIRFRQDKFGHIAQESSQRDGNKDTISEARLQRLPWIKIGLQDPNLKFLAGWDAKKKIHDHHRRVILMISDFVIVIALKSATEGEFLTCYVADSPRTQSKLKDSPVWKNPYSRA